MRETRLSSRAPAGTGKGSGVTVESEFWQIWTSAMGRWSGGALTD